MREVWFDSVAEHGHHLVKLSMIMNPSRTVFGSSGTCCLRVTFRGQHFRPTAKTIILKIKRSPAAPGPPSAEIKPPDLSRLIKIRSRCEYLRLRPADISPRPNFETQPILSLHGQPKSLRKFPSSQIPRHSARTQICHFESS
jgi:hypothetical protein